MANADTAREQQDENLIAAQRAADMFCEPRDPYAPRQQIIAAQMMGRPIGQ